MRNVSCGIWRKLLEETDLDDVASRARSRAILGRRLKPDFGRRAVNDALDAAFSPLRRQPQEGHSDAVPHGNCERAEQVL
jgi:hypothetical protein